MNPITKFTRTHSATAVLAVFCLVSMLFGTIGWLLSDKYEVAKALVYLVSIFIAFRGIVISVSMRALEPHPSDPTPRRNK